MTRSLPWNTMTQDRSAIDSDVSRIQRIDAVPRILAAVAHITGLRFAAIARVTDQHWTACAVRDDLEFGLEPGGALQLESTICNEIRQHREPVVFGHASEHPEWSKHHTPKQYGLESYVSVPIFRSNGEFFGTLCAIDRRPANLDDPAIVESLQLFAELIGLQLELVEDLDAAHSRLRDAEFRENLLASTDRGIRELIQPVVTYLYLLRTSPTLAKGDQKIVDAMESSCAQLTNLLRPRLNAAWGQIEQRRLDDTPA